MIGWSKSCKCATCKIMQKIEQAKQIKQENKVYIIKYLNKRYNSKKFGSYEDARKYVRRLVTKLTGEYDDSYSKFGFQIVAK